jgi:hypothetical protein
MPTHPESWTPDDAVADRSRKPRTLVAVESWENEGGHFPSLASVSAVPIDSLPVVRTEATKSPDLTAMRAKFLADFVGGAMGQHHNTYQHRSRVLRRLAGERQQ